MAEIVLTYRQVAEIVMRDRSFKKVPTDVLQELVDDLTAIIEVRECQPHTMPDYTYDTDMPMEWVLEKLAPALKKLGITEGSHVVWGYGPSDGLCGRPTALCSIGRKILAAIK